MDELIIKFLYKCIGSILGGIFALLVALIVGHAVRRREEISSGMLLIGANIRMAKEEWGRNGVRS